MLVLQKFVRDRAANYISLASMKNELRSRCVAGPPASFMRRTKPARQYRPSVPHGLRIVGKNHRRHVRALTGSYGGDHIGLRSDHFRGYAGAKGRGSVRRVR